MRLLMIAKIKIASVPNKTALHIFFDSSMANLSLQISFVHAYSIYLKDRINSFVPHKFVRFEHNKHDCLKGDKIDGRSFYDDLANGFVICFNSFYLSDDGEKGNWRIKCI